MLRQTHATEGPQVTTVRRLEETFGRGGHADLLLANGRVLTLDPARPVVEALAVRGGRISAIGSFDELAPMLDSRTTVIDIGGGTAVPGFHDAHMHLLSYARSHARLDSRDARSLTELLESIASRARTTSPGDWVRVARFDEVALAMPSYPDRHELDRATTRHPVRLQHRSLHLDVLNTLALQRTGLWETHHASVERDPSTGAPTGRLYHAAELLRGRLGRRSPSEIAADVRAACAQLASFGVTSIQDASMTNGPDEWALFHSLAADGSLVDVRVFMMPGIRHWLDVPGSLPPTDALRLGPVKLMLSELDADPSDWRRAVAEVRAAGRAVAVHAVSEAELVLALDALSVALDALSVPGGDRSRSGPDRIEHGAVIPDELLGDLERAGVSVVGQPGLLYERGDVYQREFAPELLCWVHRAGSLLRSGIPYAIGSDAPVQEPRPLVSYLAARRRLTRSGATFGLSDALTEAQALEALTLGPAQAVGAAQELGRLRPGALADIAVLDPGLLEAPSIEAALRPVRMTIRAGRIVWRRSDC